MTKLIWTLLLLAISAAAQTVSGQVAATTPPQSATATAGFKKVPKLTATLTCPGVPQDSTGLYLVIAGTTATCLYTVSAAPTVATTVPTTSSDTTQFTVPATVPIAAGSLTSATFLVTATP